MWPLGRYRPSLPPSTSVFLSPDFRDWTTIWARSQRSDAVAVVTVKSTCCPPGRSCGPWATSESLTLTTTVGGASIRGHAHDALATLTKNDVVLVPTHAEGVV